MTGSHRLLARQDAQPDPAIAAERKRGADLANALCDAILSRRDQYRGEGRDAVRATLAVVAREVVALAAAIRSGDDAAGLELRLNHLEPGRA